VEKMAEKAAAEQVAAKKASAEKLLLMQRCNPREY
jgi:hypothetical protein